MTNLCRKEFFIYVPEANDVETLTHASTEEQGSIHRLPDTTDQFLTEKSWVKIPLKGEIVMYAHVWDEQDHS